MLLEALEDRVLLSLAPTITTLGTSASQLFAGDSVTLTATVTPSQDQGLPSGTVEFTNTTTHVVLGTASLSGGVAVLSTSALALGNDTITAHYLGDASYQGSVTLATSSSVMSTIAGTGASNFAGDGGQANIASFTGPASVATDANGDIYLTDGNRVRRINVATGIITTVAGYGGTSWLGDGGPATGAGLNDPQGLVVYNGRLFIAERFGSRIREVNLTGSTLDGIAPGYIKTVAGNGNMGHTGDGGQASQAKVNFPTGLAIDSSGHLFIGESFGNTVRQIDLNTGIITTIAGTGTGGFSGDGGLATAAKLSSPSWVATDSSGHVFVYDADNYVIREITLSSGLIATVAGTAHVSGFSGDGGPATSAKLAGNASMTFNAAGILLIVDNGRIRQLDPSTGIISTLAGGASGFGGDGGPASAAAFYGPSSVATDASGDIIIADYGNHRVREISGGVQVRVYSAMNTPTISLSVSGGVGTGLPFAATARMSGVMTGVDTAPAASLEGVTPTLTYYVGNTPTGPGSSTAPTTTGTYTVVASFAGSAHYAAAHSAPATFSITVCPSRVAVASSKSLLFQGDSVTFTATVSAFSGSDIPTGTVHFTNATNGVNLGTFSLVGGVASVTTTAFTAGENEIVASYSGDATFQSSVAVAGRSSIVLTAAGTGTGGYSGDGGQAYVAKFNQPSGMVADGNNHLYIADQFTNRVRVVDMSTGIVTLVAGNGVNGYGGDGGQATAASVSSPQELALDGIGHLFIAGAGDNRVRMVDLASGIITTVAGGTNLTGFYGDGGPATSAQFWGPTGIAADSSGRLFISDCGNNRIRMVNLSDMEMSLPGSGTLFPGYITTVAGTGTAGYGGDGLMATLAMLDLPYGLALDDNGHLFIADTFNNVIRQMNIYTGVISTVAGTGTAGYSGDNGASASAQLNGPKGVTIDAVGNLVIADTGNNVIRQVSIDSGQIVTIGGTGSASYGGDQGPASAAMFNGPLAVASNDNGDIFVADSVNHRVRQIVGGAAVNVFQSGTQPLVTVADPGGRFNGAAYAATALVTGVMPGVDASPAPTLEGVAPTFTYYVGDTVSGQGTSTPPVHAGTYTVVASFAGSTFYAPAQSDPVTFTITRVDPTLTAVHNGAVYNGSPWPASALMHGVVKDVDLTPAPTLEGVAPTFTYYDGLDTSGPGSTTPPSTVGVHSVVAAFAGSLDYLPATSAPVYYKIVEAGPAVTDTWLTISTQETDWRKPVTVTAHVAVEAPYAGTPTGTITFQDNGVVMGTVTLVNGVATITTTELTVGEHWFEAEYSGLNGTFVASQTQNGPLGNFSSVITIAGNGTLGSGGDGSLGTNANVSPDLSTPCTNGQVLIFSDSRESLFGPFYARVRMLDLATGTISTVAGNGVRGFAGDGGPATAANINVPWGTAMDAQSHYMYFVDASNHRIRRVDLQTGIITTIAGTGESGYAGDGGQALQAKINNPTGLALDNLGNLYFFDYYNTCVRRIDLASGIITTVAGNGTGGFSGDGGPAVSAKIGGYDWDMAGTWVYSSVFAIAADSYGRLFIADEVNGRIRLVNMSDHDMTLPTGGTLAPGCIDTIAGGVSVETGDYGPALISNTGDCEGVVTDPSGRYLYVSRDYGDKILRIDMTTGLLQRVADLAGTMSNPTGLAIDPQGRLYICGYGKVAQITDGAHVTINKVYSATQTALSLSSNLIHAGESVTMTADVSAILADDDVPTGGTVTFYEGNNVLGSAPLVNGHAVFTASALTVGTHSITANYSGNGDLILGSSTSLMIDAFAGTGVQSYAGDGGPATLARFDSPHEAVVDAAGNVYIADANNGRVRKVDISTGVITTVVGMGTDGGSLDDGVLATEARGGAIHLAIDRARNILYMDFGHRVRAVNLSGADVTLPGGSVLGPGRITLVGGRNSGDGLTGIYCGDGGPAVDCGFMSVDGLAVDDAGNVYIADTTGCVVRKIDYVTGIINPVAGSKQNSIPGNGGDGGPATIATLEMPSSLAIDRNGQLYILCNYTVRKVDLASGIITTIAGNGAVGSAGDGGPATLALLNYPRGIAVDPDGSTLYISDHVSYRIRKVDLNTGIIFSIVGNGTRGGTGDGGLASDAQIVSWGLTLAPDGKIYIVDDNRIRVVSVARSQQVTVVANGHATPTISLVADSRDFDGLPFAPAAAVTGITQIPGPSLDGIAPVLTYYVGTSATGQGTTVAPRDAGTYTVVAVYPGSDHYDSVTSSAVTFTIRQVGPRFTLAASAASILAGQQVTFTATAALIGAGVGVPTGLVDFYDQTTGAHLGTVALVGGVAVMNTSSLAVGSHSITAVYAGDTNFKQASAGAVATSIIHVIAGNGTAGFGGDGQAATAAQLHYPTAAATDGSGHLYIADTTNNRIRRIDLASGIITTIAGDGTTAATGDGGQATLAAIGSPCAMAIDSGGHLFFADLTNCLVRRIDLASGIITTVAGGGTNYDGSSQPATNVGLSSPQGLAVDNSGHLFIADTFVQRVWQVDLASGIISTVAGGGATYGGSGIAATSVALYSPLGVATDRWGNLYISDSVEPMNWENTDGCLIDKVDLSTGILTRIAGTGTPGESGDGGPATAAGINYPGNMAVDNSGRLFFTEPSSNRIRMIDLASGIIITAVGDGTNGCGPDGGQAGSTAVRYPEGVAVDSLGNLFVCDTYNQRILKLTAGVQVTVLGAGQRTTPVLTITAPGGAYDALPFAATATVAGTNGQPAASLDGITPSLTYYMASDVAKANPLSGPPSAVGNYVVVADFIGDENYFEASQQASFSIVMGQHTVSIGDVTLAEGNAGTAAMTFTITLSAASDVPVTVHWATSDAKAKAPSDYQAASGTVTFTPGGSLTQNVVVQISGDTVYEADETFFVNLTSVTNATIATPRGKGTILNDETPTVTKHFGGKAVATYTDADGQLVTVSLKGPGSGDVQLMTDGGCDAAVIVINGSTDKSTLSFKLAGKGAETSVVDIVVHGALAGIAGKAVDLLGDITVDSSLGKLVMDDIIDGHMITVGGSTNPKAALTMTFDEGRDVSVSSQIHIAAITATSWLDIDGIADTVAAPWVGKLTMKGRKANPGKGITAMPGDFEADLVLSGQGNPKLTLGLAKIAGSISGGDWQITGNSGAITAGGTNAATVHATGSLASAKLGDASKLTLQVDGNAGALAAARWLGGSVQARSIKAININGDKKRGLAGDLQADITADGSNPKGLSLGGLKVAGRVLDADVELAGGAGPVKAAQWDAGDLHAARLGGLAIAGRKANPKAGVTALRGNFAADLTLTDAAAKATLGAVKIAGDLASHIWDVAGSVAAITVGGIAGGPSAASPLRIDVGGSIAALTLGAAVHVDVLAGSSAAGRHAAAVGDFNHPTAAIKAIKISGWKLAAGQTLPRLVVDSNFSAPAIGAVTLLNVQFDNSGTGPGGDNSFGLWTAADKTVKVVDSLDPKNGHSNWVWGAGSLPPDATLDLRILPL